MIRNYLLIALRNLLSNKLISVINILGLSIGLACVILIGLFVQHETSYDQHWVNSQRSYKVMRTFMPPNGSPDLFLATNAPQVGPLLKLDFPEFESVVRIMGGGQIVITHPDTNQPIYESGFNFADPEVYRVFDIPLLRGDWETALQAPFQMVINETLAEKYFGNSNPVGQTLVVANQAPILITGVMADLQQNTHLNVRAYISLSTTAAMFGDGFLQNWASNNFHTYITVPEGYDIERFRLAIPDFLIRHIAADATEWTDFIVMSVEDIHLHSQRDNEFGANGNIVTVTTFAAIALFILLIACFNFMNLSTARSANRAREVGMRKVLGADRWQIALQFLGESIFLTLLSAVIAVALVALSLPWFNNLIGLELSLQSIANQQTVVMLTGVTVLVGLFAGSYPAMYLSAFPAILILKGELTRGGEGVNLRKILVVLQFSISIALVIASGVALSQLRYAMNMDTGFTKEQVLIYEGSPLEGLGSNYNVMKQELLRNPEILFVTAANLMPGDQNTNSDGIRYEGSVADFTALPYLNIDYDFFETFDIGFLTGRSFSRERGTDIFVEPSEQTPRTTAAYILNENSARLIGFTPDDALNKWFEVARNREFSLSARGPIIGVVEDIYFSSIREAVKPVYFRLMEHDNPQNQFPNFRQMAIKVTGQNMAETLSSIEAIWNDFLPQVPIRQSFLDQNLAQLYESERRQSNIFTSFSIMAIFIAGLGLFGLASCLTEQRTREIGIRKVLGSSVFDIISLLTRDFNRLVLLANLLAWPTAWYFMSIWLENFAYRTSMGIGIFVFAALLAWIIASLTVGVLAAVTANLNPTLSLHHE